MILLIYMEDPPYFHLVEALGLDICSLLRFQCSCLTYLQLLHLERKSMIRFIYI